MDKYKEFWENNLVSSVLIKKRTGIDTGSKDYFDYYDTKLRGFDNWAVENDWYDLNNCYGKNILDIGCGNGWVSFRYACSGANLVISDISENAIKLSQKRFSGNSSVKKAKFLVCNAQDLPFSDSSFDAVTCISVLHNVPNYKKAIAEISRVVKRGGRVYLMVFHSRSFFSKIVIPVAAYLKHKTSQEVLNDYDGPGNPLTQVFSRKQFTVLLNKFNIRISDLQLRYLPKEHFPLFRIKFLSHFQGFLEKKIGFYLYIKGEKCGC